MNIYSVQAVLQIGKNVTEETRKRKIDSVMTEVHV